MVSQNNTIQRIGYGVSQNNTIQAMGYGVSQIQYNKNKRLRTMQRRHFKDIRGYRASSQESRDKMSPQHDTHWTLNARGDKLKGWTICEDASLSSLENYFTYKSAL